MRIQAALALSLLLAGCFSSDGPLFEPARGQCPFAVATIYEEIEDTPARFVFERDGADCKVTDPEGDVSRALFIPIGSDWWIVQGDEQRPTYMLMHRSGRRLTQYAPRCSDFSAQRLHRLGVAHDEERDQCTATEAAQIETLFRSWRSGFHRAIGAYREIGPAPPHEQTQGF